MLSVTSSHENHVTVWWVYRFWKQIWTLRPLDLNLGPQTEVMRPLICPRRVRAGECELYREVMRGLQDLRGAGAQTAPKGRRGVRCASHSPCPISSQ